MIKNKSGKNYYLACIRCGTRVSLQQYAHRNKENLVVGYIFVCQFCEPLIKNKNLELKDVKPYIDIIKEPQTKKEQEEDYRKEDPTHKTAREIIKETGQRFVFYMADEKNRPRTISEELERLNEITDQALHELVERIRAEKKECFHTFNKKKWIRGCDHCNLYNQAVEDIAQLIEGRE